MSTAAPEPQTASTPAPRPLGYNPIRTLLKPIASLRLTVTLFALSIVLVFFGTLAQMNAGIWTVVEKYFWSWYVEVDFRLIQLFVQRFFNFAHGPDWAGSFPIPAGKLIGGLMFFNLLAAHTLQLMNLVSGVKKTAAKGEALNNVMRLLLKRSGIYILHGGLLLLFVGEYITREFQVEQRMVITEGQTVGYTTDTRNWELAFTTSLDAAQDRVTVIPSSVLVAAQKSQTRIKHPDLPFDVEVQTWFPNSKVDVQEDAKAELAPTELLFPTADVTWKISKKDESAGTDPNQVIEMPSAKVRLYRKGQEEVIGEHVLTTTLKKADVPLKLDEIKGDLELRFKRIYKPYTLKLEKFTPTYYPGTRTPKSYTSQLTLQDPERGPDRDVSISMNAPLRHRGEALFQAGFDEEAAPNEKQTTILQVVRNPGWLLPYISCVMVMLGMTTHFLMVLIPFLNRILQPAAARAAVRLSQPGPVLPNQLGAFRYLPWACLACGVLMFAGSMMSRPKSDDMSLITVGHIPVMEGGRIKPLDTAARVYLRMLNMRETYTDTQDQTQVAMKWFLDTASLPHLKQSQDKEIPQAIKEPVLRIENLELLQLLGVERRQGFRYSLSEIGPKLMDLKAAANKARQVPEKQRTPFEQKTLELDEHLGLYQGVWDGSTPLILPPAAGKTDFRSLVQVQAEHMEARKKLLGEVMEKLPQKPNTPEELQEGIKQLPEEVRNKLAKDLDAIDKDDSPAIEAWDRVLKTYKEGNPRKFEAAAQEYRDLAERSLSGWTKFRLKLEYFLNDTGWYYQCSFLYGIVLTMSLVGLALVMWSPSWAMLLRKSALWLMVLTLSVHTFTLFARMFLMDRPLVFVTNLYSSAVFIGWVAALVCVGIERIFPISLGNLVGSVLGLSTCVVAHNLAADGGDTLEMMRAVLDTNFWLATHVTTVTFGYAATYVAGFIGLLYLILGIFTPMLGQKMKGEAGESQLTIGQMFNKAMYGIVCMATLFSFVGTVLGGIWADQSWGRFWGWDPKENGAVLIVIWNALILHARWCGLIKTRGMALLALVGNMITTWSWFGTNQLGVGLHAYGFNNTLATFCNIVWISHGMIVLVALGVPFSSWRSNPKTSG